MKLLKEYFELQQKIFDYFNYQEDWRVIPLIDETKHYWFVTGENHGHSCVWWPEPITKKMVEDGAIYAGSIYTQRFLPKWVYRGEEYTMVCVDTHTDGNKFLMVFDNTKECKDPEIIGAYKDIW
jgi:hypothetical protein